MTDRTLHPARALGPALISQSPPLFGFLLFAVLSVSLTRFYTRLMISLNHVEAASHRNAPTLGAASIRPLPFMEIPCNTMPFPYSDPFIVLVDHGSPLHRAPSVAQLHLGFSPLFGLHSCRFRCCTRQRLC